jgi:TP901 family phage tail tape measure protein
MVARTYDLSVVFKAIDKATGPIRRVGRAFDRLAGPIQKTDTRIKRLSRSMKLAGNSMRQLGSSMALRMTAPLALFGGMAVRTAATFEKSMNVVGAIVGASGEDFDALRERAKKLGAETVFTAREVAGGMHFMAMSGMEFREVLGGIEQVLRLAAAGQLDMATSADIVTNIMKSQNLTTEQLTRATDVLANAATSSNVSVQQIGESFSYAGRILVDTKLSLEEAAGAFGLLGNAGVQASRAGAGLRNSLVRLGAPSKKVVNGLRAMGDPKIWTFKNGRRELKNIVEVIAELERVGANTMDMISLLGPRAGEAIGNLVGQGSKALVDLIKKMERSGTAARIAAAAMKGMPGILAELAAAWEAAQIAFTEGEFGEWIQKILKGITWLLRKFADAPPAVKLVIAVLAGLAAILPPLIIAFGFLASGIGAIAAAGVPVLGTIAAITGGIVALIGVIGGLVAYWDKIKVMFAGIGNWIGSFFGGQKIAMGDVALGGGGFNAMSRGAGSLNKTEVAIKVMADEGSTATVERVKNKKGDAKVRVASEGYIGRHVYVGAGA